MNKKLHIKIFSVIILLLLSLNFASANTLHALQTKEVTMNVKNQTIKNVLKEIQKQTNLNFVYDEASLASYSPKTINVKNATAESVLKELLSGTDLTFNISNNIIRIVKKPAVATVQGGQKGVVVISGKVVSKDDRKPIVGATVLILGTTTGAITDDAGKFEIKGKAGDEMEVSFIGMVSVKKRLTTSESNVIIELKSDAMAVEDVVVTGIFNKPKESYTGAVTTITAKDLKNFKGQNVLSTLRNFDPALNIVQDNKLGSNPNNLPEVNIRGNSSLPSSLKDLEQGAKAQLNTPLVIMDGFEVPLQKLMDFNDEDIEQINILKDASATAIYGSRGANGVIVVITKSPKAGKLRVFAQVGLNLQLPDLSSYDLLNAREKLAFEKDIQIYSISQYGNPYNNDDAQRAMVQYNTILRDILSGVDTDWLSQPLRTSVGQKYNARLEGGSNEFRWSVSLGYNQNKGVMKNSERNVFDGSINLSYTYKNLIFKNQSSITTNNNNDSNYGTFDQYTKMNPYWRIYNEDGLLIKDYTNTTTNGTYYRTANPLYNAQFTQKNEQSSTTFINNFAIEWKLTDAFSAQARIGISKSFNSSDKYRYAGDTQFSNYTEADYLRKGLYNYGTGESFNFDGSLTLSYSKLFNEKHQIYVGAAYSMNQRDSYSYMFNMQGFSDENFNFLANAAYYSKDGKPGGSETVSRLVSFVGNATYTYNNRYYADFSCSYDGSSQFGAANKFAPFWSTGIGWNLHRESFLRNVEAINSLRIRGSYGVTGSQQFDPYKSIASYSYNIHDRYMSWNSASFMGLGNENLKWQDTKQLSGGIEISALKSRITASFDIYNKITNNLLSEMDLPLASGFPTFTENVGEVKSKGYEVMLSGYIVRNLSRNIIWSVTGKLAYNKNYVSKLSDALKMQTAAALNTNTELGTLLFEGNSQSSIYTVPSLGIDPSSGQEMFLDRNGVPTFSWNSNARTLSGVSEPKYRGNISSMFSYKNLSLNLSFGYHWGGQQYNSTLIDRVEVSRNDAYNNVDRRAAKERWLKPGDHTFYKGYYKATGGIQDKTKASSRFVQDDKMFTLQSASLQYTWNSKWVKKNLAMEYINLSLNTSDLFYIGSIKRERGLSYPFSRQVSFSLSLTF